MNPLCQEKRIQEYLKRKLTDFEVLFKMQDTSMKSKISFLYNILLNLDQVAFQQKINKWSKDCDCILTQKNWQICNKSYVGTTSLLNIKLQCLKMLNRWYITPEKIQQINHSYSPCCKGCKTMTNYIHCWWQCRVIQEF